MTKSAHKGEIIFCDLITPWWLALLSSEQFQLTGRGSCTGHAGSQWSAYHGAGENGSWQAFGAMYAKNGFGPLATFRSQLIDTLPTTAVV